MPVLCYRERETKRKNEGGKGVTKLGQGKWKSYKSSQIEGRNAPSVNYVLGGVREGHFQSRPKETTEDSRDNCTGKKGT